MDFRSLLQSMTSLSEAETKDTKTGRIHKGDYGTSHQPEEKRDEYGHKIQGQKKADAKEPEVKRGRGRPTKGDKGEHGNDIKHDTKGIQAMLGSKPKGEVGKKSVKHSLKEYIEDAEANSQIDEGGPYDLPGIDYDRPGDAPSRPRMSGGTIPRRHDDEPDFMDPDQRRLRAEQERLKKAWAERQRNKEVEEGMVGQAPIQVKPASQTNTQVIQQGDKTLGTVNNPQLAAQIKQSIGKGEMTLNPNEEGMTEEDEGKPGKNFAKIAKSAGKHYGSKAAGERVAGAVRAKLAKQGKLEEAKDLPGKQDKLDVAKPKGKLDAKDFAALRAKKKVKESRMMQVVESINFKELMNSADADVQKMLVELQNDVELFKDTGHTSDLLDSFLKVHLHHNKNKITDEGSVEDFTSHGLDKPTSYFSKPTGSTPSMAVPNKQPAPGSMAIPNGSLKSRFEKKSSPFAFEGNDMKDMQVESWEKQLNAMLTEGITVSSSTGQQGAPDSVSVNATDADAQQLLQVLRQAGVGVFGGGEQPTSGYGAPVSGEEPEGHGQEPEASPAVVGDGDDMMALIKKMTGIQDSGEKAPAGTLEPTDDEGQDYEDEETSGDVDSDEEGKTDESKEPDDSGDDEEDYRNFGSDYDGANEDPHGWDDEEDVEEGNEFSGELAKAKAQHKDHFSVDGKEYPVKEDEMEEGNAFTGKLANTPKGGEFKMGDKTYKDNSSLEEGSDEDCMECGYAMEQCQCDDEHEQVEENYANSAEDPAETELMKLKALLSMGNDMHKQKQGQTVGNPTRVAFESQMNDWKKLSGIK